MSGNKDKLIAFNYFGGKFTWLEYLYKYFPDNFIMYKLTYPIIQNVPLIRSATYDSIVM